MEVPYPVEVSYSKRFTYLDSQLGGGRPVINLKARNVVEQHSDPIYITYKYSASRLIVEPFMLVAAYFMVFVVCALVSRPWLRKGE
jgi:oligosaccharyltransferase complex subunit alpha (ribophorin I)